MSFDQLEMSIFGHWSSTSRMPETYDRSGRSRELLIRNDIVMRIAARWGIAPTYHLPSLPHGRLRIGKPNEPDTQALPDLEHGTPDGTTKKYTPDGSQKDDTHPDIGPAELLLAVVTSPNDTEQETKREIIHITQTQSEHSSLISPNVEN